MSSVVEHEETTFIAIIQQYETVETYANENIVLGKQSAVDGTAA